MRGTRCDVRGCPHRFRLFTLDWPWRCPEHRRDFETAEHLYRTALKRAEHKRSRFIAQPTMKGQSA